MAKNESISVKDAVHKLQLSLLEGVRHESQLFTAASLMSKSDYEDVVTERSITKICGYPLCNNPLPSDRPRKSRYRISLKEHKVYDLQETYLYCSTACVVNSRTFAESLEPERSSLPPNSTKINEVLKRFGELSLDENELRKKKGLGFSDLKIQEKLDVKMAHMSLEDWIGPSNAIEGYVPLIDSISKPKYSKKDSKQKSARPKTDKAKLVNDLDFTSTIIVGDQFTVPELSSDPKLKSCITNVEESEGDLFIKPCTSKYQRDRFEVLFTEPKPKSARMKTNKGTLVNDLNFTSSITKLEDSKGDQFINLEVSSGSEFKELIGTMSSLALESQFGIPEMLYDSDENISNKGVEESKKEAFVEKMAQSNETGLKSSLKCSGAKKLTRSVTWADERKTGDTCNGRLSKVQEMSVTPETAALSSSSNVEDVDGSIRLASAEACALALSHAAEAVACGEADVTDAVSEAGIVILPQPQDADIYTQKDEDMMDEDIVEAEFVPSKWPMKPGVLSSEVFGIEDSWYESPPEGFSLTLSSFATMYMALFDWITSSSLAYIYGQADHCHEEFLCVNGKEYPRKIILSDGRSSEIKLTLAGCLGRALPKVATDLRLKTLLSSIEREVGHLLNTMTFTDALPPFKLKQWHVIALLFIDALSVCRIPGVTPHMTSGRILLQKVLDGAQVSGEEYETMKDHLIPLGRVPQFSAQSGA